MANVFDYLQRRGGQKIEGGSITDIDAVILSRLSYLPFDNVVPESYEEKMTLREAAIRTLALEENTKNILWKGDPELLELAGKSERFGKLRLCGYKNLIDDERQLQFSAVTFELDENTRFISYRGTDNTLTGWQEDCALFFTFPLPSQKLAVEYFEAAADCFGGSFYLGGHSKGGNLAIYSASFCKSEYQNLILHIYNLDGPGFDSEAISESGFSGIMDRISTYVPQSSIFGMMFEHEESYIVIKSNQKGFFQHDIYSWEVENDSLFTLNTTTNTSVFFDHTLTDFVEKMAPEERKSFTEALFNILKTTEDRTFNEIIANWFIDSGKILKSLKSLDPETRSIISSAILSFIKSARGNFSDINPITNEINKLKIKSAGS